MLEYAEIDPERYNEDDLIDCISNKQQVLEIIKGPKNRFKGPGGHQMAAVLI